MTESAIHYYAYGSNMSTARLVERIPRAAAIGAARIVGYRLRCNKLGADGSGKANLVREPDGEAWGVVFELPDAAATWPLLDRFEVGYERVACAVEHATLGQLSAQMYLALDPSDSEVAPFHWYLGHMTIGAREHGLPAHYAEHIAGWPTRR